MATAVTVVSAIIPGLLWLWVFTHGRSYRGAPHKILFIAFVLGMVSVIPAAFIESQFIDEDSIGFGVTDLSALAAAMFFIVGPVEEASKFLSVRVGVYRTRHLREPLDGLIYGAAASLGFATAENIGYAFAYGPEVMIARGPVSTVAHVIFGSLWALTLNPGSPPFQRKLTGFAGLLAAAFLHGLFNVLAFSGWGIFFALLLIVVGMIVVLRMFRRVKARSAYHLRRNIPMKVCPVCRAPVRYHNNFCAGCGTRSSAFQAAQVICSNCKHVSGSDAKFCNSCGDLFVFDNQR
ncbi:MAG: PrsW family glutamic-type intramembrane protease [Chloroflexi bacterium]|nr:PrsW family glutamic-type intramembrane protease [Chloroflexota bacterium]